jgi:hypothetical protein
MNKRLSFGHTLITRIAKRILFFTVKKILGLVKIVLIGCGASDGMNQPRLRIDTDVSFHTKKPLISFLSLVHFRITLTLGILGNKWGQTPFNSTV